MVHQTIEGELEYQEDEETGECTTTETTTEVDRIITSDPDQQTLDMFNRIEEKYND